MINPTIIKEIGLTKNEVEVYLILLELGEAKIYEISNKSKISRPNIYDTVKKLVEKGLVTSIVKDRKTYFKPLPPTRLLEILKDRENNILNILPKLNQIYEQKKIKPSIEVFEGAEGLKAIMDDMLKVKKEILIFGGADTDYIKKKIPEYSIKRLFKEKKKLGIKTKIIYSRDVQPFKGPGYELKKLSGNNLGCVSYWTYGDRVAIGIWSNPLLIIRIISEDVARVYKRSIRLVWGALN